MLRHSGRRLWIVLICWLGLLSGGEALAQYRLRIRDICRVKGQEENSLHGLGLVVGLNWTGDGETPTIRALAKMMELMGNPVAQDARGNLMLDELSNAKNVALVFITATVPSEGARQGERLHCQVSAVSAKSLKGGHLMLAPLRGPRPDNPRVYAFAQGAVELDDQGPATVGNIHNGCQLEEDFSNAFVKDGKITLVLDKAHASFQTALQIEEQLNDSRVSGLSYRSEEEGTITTHAKAVDQVNVEIRIPETYASDIVGFVSVVLDTQIVPPQPDARVVVDKRNGVIIVGENVMVGRVAVSHKNIAVQTGEAPALNVPLKVIDQLEDTSATRLQALVDALNALKVSTEDIIHIIENLEQSGDLYGRLIVRK